MTNISKLVSFGEWILTCVERIVGSFGTHAVAHPLGDDLFLPLVYGTSRVLREPVIGDVRQRIKITEENSVSTVWSDVHISVLKVGKSALFWDCAK
jgi:hypothetical protein